MLHTALLEFKRFTQRVITLISLSTRTILGTKLWTEYRPVIKIGPKGALGNHEIRPIHFAPSLGQSIVIFIEMCKHV